MVKLVVYGAYPDQPLTDIYTIEEIGTVALGPTYGRVKIGGLSVLEAERKVKEQLSEILTDVNVQITLVSKATEAANSAVVPSGATLGGVAQTAPTLLYDDKTFDQWRSLWKNELKTEKRTEAIKALAAFGRAGYGKEAVEAILDVAGEYDFRTSHNSAEGQLEKAIVEVLTGGRLPAELWLSNLLNRYEDDPNRYYRLASRAISSIKPPINGETASALLALAVEREGKLASAAIYALDATDSDSEEVRNLLDELVNSNSKEEAKLGIKLLSRNFYSRNDQPEEFNTKFRSLPALFTVLTHPDKAIRGYARYELQRLNDDEAMLVAGEVLKRLRKASSDDEKMRLLRVLSAAGKGAAPAESDLSQIIQGSSTMEVRVAAGCALAIISDLSHIEQAKLAYVVAHIDPTKTIGDDSEMAKLINQTRTALKLESSKIFPNHPLHFQDTLKF